MQRFTLFSKHWFSILVGVVGEHETGKRDGYGSEFKSALMDSRAE